MQLHEEKDLLQILRRDPQMGLKEILSRYGGVLHGIVRRILPDERDVEECLSDVLVTCWRKAETLEEENSNLRAWLIVTARNKALDRYRRLRRETVEPLPEDFELIADELVEPRQSEAEALIAELVEGLQPPDREIFIRRYYGLQSGREIGKALHMEEHAVNVRLSRGRQRLKRQFLQIFGKE